MLKFRRLTLQIETLQQWQLTLQHRFARCWQRDAAAVSREALIARLEQTAASGVFQWEGNRRARVVEDLDLVRRQLAAQHVRIPAAVDVRERLLEDLSAGIALRLEKRQKP